MPGTLDSNRLDDLQARIEDLQRAQHLRDDLSRILASDSDLERALAQVLERLGPALGADGGAFVLFDEGRQVWRTILPTTSPAAERSQQATQGLFGQGLIEELVGQDARLISDTSQEEAWQALAATGGPRTVLSIPIQTAGSPARLPWPWRTLAFVKSVISAQKIWL